MAFLPVRRVNNKKKDSEKDPFINITGVPRFRDRGVAAATRRYFAKLNRKEQRKRSY